jgi:hypothetical protein
MPLLLAGCLPFWRGKPEPPRPPEVVQRFFTAAEALGVPPASPSLAEVTHALGRAVVALPATPPARELGQKIEGEAQAMETQPATALAHAPASLALALQAIDGMKRPAGAASDRRHSVDEAQKAVRAVSAPATDAGRVAEAYRAIARALLVVTGAKGSQAPASALLALVARLAVDDTEQAQRTAAQALYAVADAFDALPSPSSKVHERAAELRTRAAALGDAEPLDYAARLKTALDAAVDALDAVGEARRLPALDSLRRQARDAVARITPERPFELQRARVQDALRLVCDGITIASAR